MGAQLYIETTALISCPSEEHRTLLQLWMLQECSEKKKPKKKKHLKAADLLIEIGARYKLSEHSTTIYFILNLNTVEIINSKHYRTI